jgi:hypothetical protein
MATILIKRSNTAAAVPASGALTNSTDGAELAVNTADRKIFAKNSGGTVVELSGVKTDLANTFTASQRGTVTTDNDGSFDMSVTNNFKCTPTGNITLTFTNITSGQSGFILLVNTGGHTVSAHANTKVSTTALATITVAGTYLLSYFSDGTNVFVVNSGALA